MQIGLSTNEFNTECFINSSLFQNDSVQAIRHTPANENIFSISSAIIDVSLVFVNNT